MIIAESDMGNRSMATRITVSLSDKDHAALAAMAWKNDVSLSWLSRKAVMEFLQRYAKGSPQLTLDLPVKAGSEFE